MKCVESIKAKHPKLWEIFKFLVVGGIATVIDFVIMSVVIYAFNAKAFNYVFWDVFVHSKDLSPTWLIILGTGCGFVAGLIFNYVFSVTCVFDNTKFAKTTKGFSTFTIFDLIGLGIHLLGMYIGYDLLHWNEWVVKIILTLIVLVFNYITRKIFVFGSKGENDGK